MARRRSRYEDAGPSRRRPRRWAVFSLAFLAVAVAAVAVAPTVAVHTDLRDRPLTAALAGIDGSVSSGAAHWHWLGGIEYRDIVLRDRQGRAVAMVPRLVVDRGLLALAADPRDLGTVRLIGPEVLVDVRAGGSSIEDILAPWLAGEAIRPAPAFEIELVDGVVEVRDTVRGDAWRIAGLMAAGRCRPDTPLAGWTVAGRLVRAAAGAEPALDARSSPADAEIPRLDRGTVAAGATAILASPGGFSCAAPEAADGGRRIAVAAHRMPLGWSGVLATRLGLAHFLEGTADVRCDVVAADLETRIAGSLVAAAVTARDAATGKAVAAVESCDVPIDCSFIGDRIVVRTLTATSPLFRAEASGRIRLPSAGSWEWADGLVEDDFAVAAAIDLAALSRSLAGGLAVRPDVRVTAGQLHLAATSRADGDDRVLELRLASRDLAAVQSVVAAPGSATRASVDTPGSVRENGAGLETGAVRERTLRWKEPFSGWIRGRRGPARDDRLRIEDARLTSRAVEVSVAGDARAGALTWTLDLDGLVAEAAELLDLRGARLAGKSSGRVAISRPDPQAPAHIKAQGVATALELSLPGRPAWQDEELTVEAEGVVDLSGAAAVVNDARLVVAAAGDRLHARLDGGAFVGLDGLLGRASGPWLRAVAGAEPVGIECGIEGDLGRWHARLAAFLPGAVVNGVEVAGSVAAAATLAARGEAWQVTRGNCELEKLTVRAGAVAIREPRVVASAAGFYHPRANRFDIAAGEILSTTMSLRTGGLSFALPRDPRAAGSIDPFDICRGKLQYRVHVGRLADWLAPADGARRWKPGGDVAGTVEIADAATGVNLLLDATATQLVLAKEADGQPGREPAPPQPVWSEPRGRVVVELSRPRESAGMPAERLQIDRLAIESETLALAARGSVESSSGRRLVALEGSAGYDWGRISGLIAPWTGGTVRIAGAGSRPFMLRLPLDTPPAGSRTDPAPAADQIPLPPEWLSGVRGRDGRAVDTAVRVAQPVKATRRSSGAERLRGVVLDTSTAWTAADIGGFAVAGGELPLRLVEGQLSVGPFDVAASGGRIRGAPWLRIGPDAPELVVPAGRVVDRVTLSGPLCGRFTTWLSPLLGHATHARGIASIDMAGARLPLAEPFAGELAAQVIFDELEVTPTATLEPLANLLVRLRSAIDPRFAVGDKTVLLRVRPEPVQVRIANRRLWHEGLVMDMGDLAVRSRGSVGADGSLAMVVEVALRAEIAGQTPVIARLLRTPLAIPLKGTIDRPQFDTGSIDVVIGRIVENTAQAVIGEGLSRGLDSLETLFGNPPPGPGMQPPPAPGPPQPPLAFPPR